MTARPYGCPVDVCPVLAGAGLALIEGPGPVWGAIVPGGPTEREAALYEGLRGTASTPATEGARREHLIRAALSDLLPRTLWLTAATLEAWGEDCAVLRQEALAYLDDPTPAAARALAAWLESAAAAAHEDAVAALATTRAAQDHERATSSGARSRIAREAAHEARTATALSKRETRGRAAVAGVLRATAGACLHTALAARDGWASTIAMAAGSRRVEGGERSAWPEVAALAWGHLAAAREVVAADPPRRAPVQLALFAA